MQLSMFVLHFKWHITCAPYHLTIGYMVIYTLYITNQQTNKQKKYLKRNHKMVKTQAAVAIAAAIVDVAFAVKLFISFALHSKISFCICDSAREALFLSIISIAECASWLCLFNRNSSHFAYIRLLV